MLSLQRRYMYQLKSFDNMLTVWLLLCSKPSRFISRYQYLYLCCVCSVFENRFCSLVLFPVMFGGRGYVHNQQLHDYNCVYLEFRGTRPRPLCIATGPSRLLTGSAQAQRFTVYQLNARALLQERKNQALNDINLSTNNNMHRI